MIDMVTLGDYKSQLFDIESVKDDAFTFKLTLKQDGNTYAVIVKGEVVELGEQDARERIVEYITSLCVKRVRQVLDGVDTVDEKLVLLAYFDMQTWSSYNIALGNKQVAKTDWRTFEVRLLTDAVEYSDVSITLLVDGIISKVHIDLKESEVTGDKLHRKLIPIFLTHPNITMEEAQEKSTDLVGADLQLIRYAKSAWANEMSRKSHLN